MEWKRLNVLPVFKRGGRETTLNPRIVYLMTIVCKTLDKILINQRNDCLNWNNNLHERQDGFREKRLSVTNLLDFCNRESPALDKTN